MSVTSVFHWTSISFYLLYANMACLAFAFIIHFFVPKVMIKTYFKEPYFSPLEIKLFTGPPYACMRTAMRAGPTVVKSGAYLLRHTKFALFGFKCCRECLYAHF